MTENKHLLEECTFKFSQEANCLSNKEYEEIRIEYNSSLGLDRDTPNNGFFILKTEGWAVDSVADLEVLFARIKKVMEK